MSQVHAIDSNNISIHVIIITFMFNHFHCNILMYNENISKGHKCRDNFCPPLFSPMVQFNIEVHGEQTEQFVPIDTMLKAHIIIMAQFSIK